MAEDLQEYLKLLIPTVDGLEAIIVTDKDGVPVAKANTTSVPPLVLKPGFLSTFASATEQVRTNRCYFRCYRN
jgi:mitogen-activated protein kinase kinase 1 interacting protein 1